MVGRINELIGKRVVINYFSKFNDMNNQAAVLTKVNGTKIYIESEGQEFTVEKERIRSIKTARRQTVK